MQNESINLTKAELTYLEQVTATKMQEVENLMDLTSSCFNECVTNPPGTQLSRTEKNCLHFCAYRKLEAHAISIGVLNVRTSKKLNPAQNQLQKLIEPINKK